MNGTHQQFHFSVTIFSDDLAVVGCLRSLSQHSQATGNARIPWGGTKQKDWERDRHHVTFRFTSTLYRDDFLREARRLLPTDLWRVARQSDSDPASPQAA